MDTIDRTSKPGIILLGLGPGDPLLITRQAWSLLESIPEIYLRTRQHPLVEGLPSGLAVYSFDDLYDNADTFDAVYAQIVDRVLQLGQRPQGVVYGVPGHPFVAEATAPEIVRRARSEGIPVQVIEGVSILEPTFAALGIDPLPHTAIVDALLLGSMHVPPFPPGSPAVVAQIHAPTVASNVKLTLMEVYPDDHEVRLVHGAGTAEVMVESVPLHAIDQSRRTGLLTTLHIPPLDQATSFEAFQEIVAHLRAPEGCPWDREQTHQSLRPHLIEEAYEVLAALDAGDPEALCEELGDLLLQIILHAQIANEYGDFNINDVLRKVHTKIVNRHPHVFGDQKLPDAGSVLINWERLKAIEREAGKQPEAGLLDSIAPALPALITAQTYQKRAARVGFDWPDVEGVLGKIMEEIEEVRDSEDDKERALEIGDLLFALVNLTRWYDIDAESALREANARFKQRFSYIEKAARSEGRSLSDLSLDEMEALWQIAKKAGDD